MPPVTRPTHSNIQAAQELIPVHARRFVQRYSAALSPLAELLAEPAVPAVTAIGALAQLQGAMPEITQLRRELAGAVLLGGGSRRMTAAACGVTPGTLTLWGPGTWAEALGVEVLRDPEARDGWRAA